MKSKYFILCLFFFIILPVHGNFKNTYKSKKQNHSNLGISFAYFPAKFRKIELSASELYLGFPIFNLSCGYNYQVNPLLYLGITFDFFYGSGNNITEINNYSLETASKRSGFYVGIIPSICIPVNKIFSISNHPCIKIGRATDSLNAQTEYNGIKTLLFHFNESNISLAFVHKLLFDFTIREKSCISFGILYQFSTIFNEKLWESSDFDKDGPDNPHDFGKGLGFVVEYKWWFKKKAKE